VSNDIDGDRISALDKIVGMSTWTAHMRDQIVCVAQHKFNVLITEPSGTRKELAGRAGHKNSARSDRAFIPVDAHRPQIRCLAVTYLAISKGPFPRQPIQPWARFEQRMAAQSFWMRLMNWNHRYKPSCCECCSSERSFR